MNEQTDTGSAIVEISALARMSNAIQTGNTEAPIALVHKDYSIHDLEEYQEKPRRISETIEFNTVDSFIEYMKEWTDPDSVIFADEKQRALKATIDYHRDASAPTWGSHVGQYTANYSREFLAWQKAAGSSLSQIAFAEFIEDRIADVVDPAGADLLERVLKLQIMTKGSFGSAIRLQTGEFSLQYAEEQQKGSVEFPEVFAIGIPLFHGGDVYKVKVRLRYRLEQGRVTFICKLVEIDRAIEHAFSEVVQKVSSGLSNVKIYQGSK